MSQFIRELENVVNSEWDKIRAGRFFQLVQTNFNKELYVRVLAEIYHYTKNNSINQAAAAFCSDYQKTGLLRFAYRHAMEELGHEKMILRDLETIGVGEDSIIGSKPLPPTEALNGYLFSVAIREGIIPRLGYSFWAEECYDQIAPLLDAARKHLNLKDDQLTFFVAHSSIDAKHSQEVRDVISKWVVTDEEKEAVKQVARTTLYLTGQILECVASDYLYSEQQVRKDVSRAM